MMLKSNITVVFLILYVYTFSQVNNDTIRTLFIGNSITYFNNMPNMFQEIARNKGKNVKSTYHAPGGTGIFNHFTNPEVYNLIRNNSWDIVVLQPGTGESAGVSWPVDITISRLKTIVDSVYFYNPCTKVFLYQIPYGVNTASTYDNYFDIQTMYRDSITKMTDSLRLQFVPAGESARAYYTEFQNLLLHNSYGDIHPNSYGSYLTACTFYSTIFQDSISGCSYFDVIPQDSAFKFFSIVDSVVFKNLENWRMNTYNLNANFTYNMIDNSINLINQSSNYDSIVWNFGDNTTSIENDVSHTYSTPGNYTIKLYAYHETCVDSVQSNITITFLNIPKNTNLKNPYFYPNPSSEVVNMKDLQEVKGYIILNNLGQIVMENYFNQIEIDHYKVDVSELTNGMYTLCFLKKDEVDNKCYQFIIYH